MNPVVEALARAVRDLTVINARWALVGGFAVSAWADPRFTRDVDLCIAVDDDQQAEQVVAAMRARDYRIETIIEHEWVQRLATVRLSLPALGGVVVDLLFASSGIEPEIVQSAGVIEIMPGVLAAVARPPHLVVLKLLARTERRPQDAADLVALRPLLAPADEAEVLRLAHLVTTRGFHRDRDVFGLAHAYLAGNATAD